MDENRIENIEGEPEFREVMSIQMSKDGRIKVVGSIIADLMASYGLLELAKDTIRQHHNKDKAKVPLIKMAGNGILSYVRNGKH